MKKGRTMGRILSPEALAARRRRAECRRKIEQVTTWARNQYDAEMPFVSKAALLDRVMMRIDAVRLGD